MKVMLTGRVLQSIRETAGCSVQAMANMFGVERSSYKKYESGTFRIPETIMEHYVGTLWEQLPQAMAAHFPGSASGKPKVAPDPTAGGTPAAEEAPPRRVRKRSVEATTGQGGAPSAPPLAPSDPPIPPATPKSPLPEAAPPSGAPERAPIKVLRWVIEIHEVVR